MNKTIPFTKEDIKAYLDSCIELWRGYRNDPSTSDREYMKRVAPYYIDAFQSVRKTLFGELKK